MYKLEYELDLKELSIEELKNLQEDIKKELARRTVNVVDKTVTNLSASGDTKFGDTSDDTHQFTGSVFVSSSLVVTGSGTETTTTINGTHVSSSLNISGSQFYGDGSQLENIAKGSNTQIQFNDNNSLNGSGYL